MSVTAIASAVAIGLNAIMKMGIAWAEYNAIMERAREAGREVNADDIIDLQKRAGKAIDNLGAAIETAKAEEAEAEVQAEIELEPEIDPDAELDPAEDDPDWPGTGDR